MAGYLVCGTCDRMKFEHGVWRLNRGYLMHYTLCGNIVVITHNLCFLCSVGD
jgi:hypothetical protein